jgi:hypothetical protein
LISWLSQFHEYLATVERVYTAVQQADLTL